MDIYKVRYTAYFLGRPDQQATATSGFILFPAISRYQAMEKWHIIAKVRHPNESVAVNSIDIQQDFQFNFENINTDGTQYRNQHQQIQQQFSGGYTYNTQQESNISFYISTQNTNTDESNYF